MQLELKLAEQPTISAPGKLDLAWERFGAIAKEVLPLFRRHWKEIALHQDKIALDPHWERYYALDLTNLLHVLTARDGGRLVGYVFMVVDYHLHYASTVFAVADMFWLDPDYRFGWEGVRLFKEVELGMRQLGAKVIALNYKRHFQDGRLDRLFHRLGYSPTDIVVSKYIG